MINPKAVHSLGPLKRYYHTFEPRQKVERQGRRSSDKYGAQDQGVRAVRCENPQKDRTDDMTDAEDDGSLGLTATHASNTWVPPTRGHAYQAGLMLPSSQENNDEAVAAENPPPAQRLPWNNALHLVVTTSSSSGSGPDANSAVIEPPLDLQAPSIAKDTNQKPWSLALHYPS